MATLESRHYCTNDSKVPNYLPTVHWKCLWGYIGGLRGLLKMITENVSSNVTGYSCCRNTFEKFTNFW